MQGKLRQQYHFKKVGNDVLIWDVNKLIRKSTDLPTIWIALKGIDEFDQAYWYDQEGDAPTCRSIAKHAQLIGACDLRHPILLAEDGSVMDGMHRVCRAFLEKRDRILAKRFPRTPPPDFMNVPADQLPY